MSEKMKNLWVRTVSGAVLAVVMLGAIAWSQWSFGLLLAALLVVGMTGSRAAIPSGSSDWLRDSCFSP